MVKDEIVISIKNTDAGRREDVSPPKGADGCVILIERRSDSKRASPTP